MSEPTRLFPIQRASRRYGGSAYPTRIPWSVADLAYSVYSSRYGTDQTLGRLAERGGFHPEEMDEFLPDWRERSSEVAALTAQLAEAQRKRDEAAALALANEDAGRSTVAALVAAQAEAMALREALAACLHNMEWRQQHFPGEHGCAVRDEAIAKARTLLGGQPPTGGQQ